ncbi:MAG: ROK family protein [Tannerella sp.]|jgi:glucokinase|nr:ROK family protein [Tannerella sp.]
MKGHIYNVGIDVGGSHISSALVDASCGSVLKESIREVKIDSSGSIEHITGSLRTVLQMTVAGQEHPVESVGIAMPGPFDYPNGISLIKGVHKFDAIYGLNLKQIIRDSLPVDHIVFENDAVCFALGEHYAGAAKGTGRSLTVTLGTGFGSTFLIDGTAQTSGDGVPADGYLYNQPFENSIADDYFSTRWFTGQWKDETGECIAGVKEIAEQAQQNNRVALRIFETFTDNLSGFIAPWLKRFEPEILVLGGSIARSSLLFMDRLRDKLINDGINQTVSACLLWDQAPIIGAAMNARSSKINQKSN